MPKRSKFKNIALVEIEIEQLRGLYQLRMDDLQISGEKLSDEANRLRKRAQLFRIITIILGVVVATKGIVDQLMITYSAPNSTKLLFDVTFTVIGLAISTVAWSQDAFNPGWKAAGLMELSNKAMEFKRGFMARGDNPRIDYDNLETLIGEQNKALAEIYKGATVYDINLAHKSGVDFSKSIQSSR